MDDERDKQAPAEPPAAQAAGHRLWLFRLAALILAPLLTLGVLELGLRFAGYGYEADFLVPVSGTPDRGTPDRGTPDRGGDGVLTTNPRFGWRFFPRNLARSPVPLEIANDSDAGGPDPYRIVVLGGSAARGTPDSAYSFGRVLETMLEARHPGARFEVLNAAMTAINSHVVLPIARDCARLDPDLFVVYLGHNEVVGPYGAATIFRPLSSSLGGAGLPLIRAGIALRALRLGQLADGMLSGAGTEPRQWQGMEMFLEQRIAADDPRLEPVYGHLRQNLADIVAAAEDAGASTVLVTVAANLRHQPPFASLHRSDLEDADLERWQTLFDQGVRGLSEGRHEAATRDLEAAAAIDAAHAELHFHLGYARLGLGRPEAARESFLRARDLDALRFRADTRINGVIREVAAAEAGRGAVLVDAERALAEATGGIPGDELFHEHVHLRFAGNYALAKAVLDAVEDRLPATIRTPAPAPLPPIAAVAERLALTPFDQYDLERDILRIVARPPFVGQSGHRARIEGMRRRLAGLRRGLTAEVWNASEAIYRQQLELDPDNLELRRRFATRLQAQGRAADAAAEWRTLVERLPGIPVWHANLALALADDRRPAEALAELEELAVSWPQDPAIRVNLGIVLESEERFEEATLHYRQALALDPDDPVALFNLATAELKSGEVEGAVELYEDLARRHPGFASAHHNLGHAYEQRGDLAAAIASYRKAVAAEPDHAGARNSLALALEGSGQIDEAREQYLAALEYQPDFALARFNLADLLLTHGRAAEAAAQYREGLRYRPDNTQARYNLAGTLQLLGDLAAAAGELRRVLDDRGEDPAALQNLAWILATADDPAVQDTGEAVELAERAARATDHRSPEILDTLAAAYALAGRHAEAVAALEQAAGIARAAGQEPLAASLAKRLAALRAL